MKPQTDTKQESCQYIEIEQWTTEELDRLPDPRSLEEPDYDLARVFFGPSLQAFLFKEKEGE